MENTDAPGVRGEPGERQASGRGRDSPDAHFFFADVKMADCYTASNYPGDMQHEEDEEDFSKPLHRRRPSSQEGIPGAARALSDVTGYTEPNEAMIDDPWNPFSSEADFNLASWLVPSKVSKSQFDAYFAEGLGGMDARSFRSAYILCSSNLMYWTRLMYI